MGVKAWFYVGMSVKKVIYTIAFLQHKRFFVILVVSDYSFLVINNFEFFFEKYSYCFSLYCESVC